ncbi:MAG: hypothetical protein EXR86_01870 [Gammaproteobacteria bacterium]|nr:hypothetical protein [Gammaproteobacteria bacterium]
MHTPATYTLVALSLLFGSNAMSATSLTNWGTLATISQYTCISDFCGADSPGEIAALLNMLAVGPTDGAAGQTSANVSSGSWPTPGSASGTATVSTGLGIPILKAGATSPANTRLGGQALAIQAYEYTGQDLSLITLNWHLTGSISNPDADPLTGLVVFAGFFNAAQLPTFPDVATPINAYTLLAGLALASPADNFREFTIQNASANESGTIAIQVANGDAFYLIMGLLAGAGGCWRDWRVG